MKAVVKALMIRFMCLFFGFFLYACGIVVMVKANIGYAPWDIFHSGFSGTFGISFGMASVLTGFAIVLLVAVLGEKMGIATILNMIFIGVFTDMVMAINIIPLSNNFIVGILMLFVGMFIISTGTYYYINSAFGAGPRDSLMTALMRITKLPAGICRSTLELIAAFIGWLLGGMAGIGTVISVFAIGFCIQVTFKYFKFDPSKVEHETIDKTMKTFITLLKKEQKDTV